MKSKRSLWLQLCEIYLLVNAFSREIFRKLQLLDEKWGKRANGMIALWAKKHFLMPKLGLSAKIMKGLAAYERRVAKKKTSRRMFSPARQKIWN